MQASLAKFGGLAKLDECTHNTSGAHPGPSGPRPGPSPLGPPARPGSGPPRRFAEALVIATDRPTDGIGFNDHHPGVAAQIAGSTTVPDRSAETGHLATDHQRA